MVIHVLSEYIYIFSNWRYQLVTHMCMCVLQVLSSSTAHALELIGRQDTQSLCLFIQKVDTFFDCLNVRNIIEGLHTKKPALLPYRDVQDWRFEVNLNVIKCYVYQHVQINLRCSACLHECKYYIKTSNSLIDTNRYMLLIAFSS